MILDDAQRQHVQEWLIAHGGIPDCSFCMGNAGRWEYFLYTPIIVGKETKFGMRARRTIVELACEDCGYLLTFNAVAMGLHDPFFADSPESAPPSPD